VLPLGWSISSRMRHMVFQCLGCSVFVWPFVQHGRLSKANAVLSRGKDMEFLFPSPMRVDGNKTWFRIGPRSHFNAAISLTTKEKNICIEAFSHLFGTVTQFNSFGPMLTSEQLAILGWSVSDFHESWCYWH
jgi:hypothetical protein